MRSPASSSTGFFGLPANSDDDSRAITPATAGSAATLNSSSSSSAQQPHRASQGLYDYVCGVVSGIGKVVAGYPFDTVKSRVQTGRFSNSITAFWGTLRHEGPMAFYQGVTVPAATVCFVGGIMFYVNGCIRRWIQPDTTKKLTYKEMLTAGCGAGFAVGVVLTPMEVIKVRLQVANRAKGGHTTVREVARHMRVRDFFSGATPTLIREVCTFGLFFPVNEYVKDVLQRWFPRKPRSAKDKTDNNSVEQVQLWIRILAAGTGGVVGWMPCYPVDVVKSVMQVSPQGTYKTWVHCLGSQYRKEGVRGLYKGLLPCIVRAFPAYAAQFLLYEYVRAQW